MRDFLALVAASSAPAVGSFESHVLEFKVALNRAENGKKPDYPELAKDVAAFANSAGGTILVGADEGPPRCLKRYMPLNATQANEVATAYVQAGEAWCFPRVVLEIVQLD